MGEDGLFLALVGTRVVLLGGGDVEVDVDGDTLVSMLMGTSSMSTSIGRIVLHR